MHTSTRDYSILNKFGFERKPVGVKFLPERPEGIAKLTKELNFCEMLKEAQTSEPFYRLERGFSLRRANAVGIRRPGADIGQRTFRW